MSPKSPKKIVPQNRDIEIFDFLWKWKLATTRAIAERFFQGSKLDAAYVRLNSLRNAGYLQIQCMDSLGNSFVWTLTQKGFSCIKESLPELKEDGFRSESLEHDLITLAVHLGEWLVSAPDGVQFCSEQQLRRLHFEHYPSWVPKCKSRRPDGYWLVPYKNKWIPIALEVEINSKVSQRYGVIAQFYKDNPSIYRTVWIVPSHGIAKSIQDNFRMEVGNASLRHDFVIRKEFEKLGWNAPIYLGTEQGRTLGYLLGHEGGHPLQGSLQSPSTSKASAILDTRKRPGNSKTSANSRSSKIGNRMAIRPISSPTNHSSTSPINLTSQATVYVHINNPSFETSKTEVKS